ncbi:MAG TPA: Omp28-related outer membrane protein, partial [Saprospiraceae bacterium]|nr:Omp28-related outer membrane protein [Saprospiraceae bacterium]
MLKKLLFASAAFAFALTASAQTHPRRVLVEEFTNASCGPCASQNPGFNAVLNANYDLLTAIKYQVNFPGYDPMNEQNPGEVDTRRGYYGVNAVPHGVTNGANITNDCNAYDGCPACLASADLITGAANLTPVTMNVSHSVSATYDSVFVQISVTSDNALTGNLRLRAAVTEEAIYFDEAPGSNGETEFYQVMRKMLPNAGGTATGDFAAGETKTYTFAWKIGYAYDLNKIAACAWLQNDDTKEVWQSERSLPVGGIPAAGVKIPSAFSFACTAGYVPTYTITNIGDEPLTSAELRWRLGNGLWKNDTWTGNLAPGASTQATIDTNFTEAGTFKIEVEVLNSNNGVQTNLVNALSTLNVKALIGPATALPFAHTFQTGAVPPPGWTGANIAVGTGTQGWKLATNAGSGSSRSTRCTFFTLPSGLGNPTLTTPKIDLSQANGVTTFSFDHAYAYYNASFFDSLRIEVSNDCGVNWKTIYHDGKDGLSTAPPVASPDGGPGFVPTADQWTSDAIDISEYNGSPELLIRLVGESGYGNNLFVDNINVTTLVDVKELHLNTFSLRPNPTRDVAQVRFGLEKPESITLLVYNGQGTLVQTNNLGDLTSGEHTVTLDANSLPSGSYRVMLQGKEGVANAQWV